MVFLHKPSHSRARSTRLSCLSKRQKRDIVIATVLIGIVGVFLFCHSLKFVINLVELWIIIKGKQFIIYLRQL